MNLRKALWILIILLIAIIIWETINIKENYRKIVTLDADNEDEITKKILKLQRKVNDQITSIQKLEKIATWNQENDPLSWVSSNAIRNTVSIIGVEHLPPEKALGYERIPVNIVVKGDYNALGRFINELERSEKKLKIDSLRVRHKERKPEELIMDVLISYFIKSEL